MKIQKIMDIDHGCRLCKLSIPSGEIFTVEALKNMKWQLMEATVDTAQVISFLDRCSYTKSIDHALRLINGKKR